jgi:DNA-binding NtrC family response regulator
MKKIAIIDDDITLLQMLQRYVSKGTSNIQIEIFTDALYSLDEIVNSSFDLILLDINMPVKNGIDILHEVKRKNPNIKIIMMSAGATINKAKGAIDISADGFLTKPFKSIDDVSLTIKKVLEV